MRIANPNLVPAGVALALAITMAIAMPAAPQASQPTFGTPQEAAQAIMDAAEHNDTAALLKLFGPGGKDIVESGDPTADTQSRAEFARTAHEKLKINQDPSNPNRAALSIGAQDWPFPVPLVRKDGKWHFDAPAGKVEILAHRIGENEVNAVEVCRGYVEAQMEYAAREHDKGGVLEYAQKIVSSPGKEDGLYWEGASKSLVPKAFVNAAAANVAEGARKLDRYHGYYFRILKAQGPDAPGGAFDYVVKGKMIGGFALVAYPAEYAVSGVKTFVVNHQGTVYEKDLGPNTAALARQMARINPDKSWRPVEKD
ncbi:MAG TPA: DUF2950 domain-containing protein [Candidatus Acidoferrales bacterium]|jgi:hypothetical protein|nr:DUF2950 domain-containing protein [Candidatus Acidoferrales bacterium]